VIVLMTDVSWERCITAYPYFRGRVIEINYSRSLAKSNDLPKSLSQVGIDYLDSLILRVTLGTKYPKINLYWRPLRDGGKLVEPLGTHIKLMGSMERGGADLMMQLLRLDPIKRLTAHDALDHPWFWTSPKPAVCSK